MSEIGMPMLSRQNLDSDISSWFNAARSDGAMALINKEMHWTSFDVVAKLRSLTHIRKIGHAGTLDPLATGLLIVCLGKATKRIEEFQGLDKRYAATIKLGATTRTDDAEAPEENMTDTNFVTFSKIVEILQNFQGAIEQIPPAFSAVKMSGQPLYKSARKGIKVEPQPRKVHIADIAVQNIALPFIEIDVICSKGTYIRSLARDVGAALGCGGYLASLRRTAIGDFIADNAVSISDVRNASSTIF